MCGMIGSFHGGLKRDDVLLALNAIKYRGTQEPIVKEIKSAYSGFEGTDFMGHVRLPIVGLSPEYDQPMEDGLTMMSFVGEFLNYKDYDPRSESDTASFFEIMQKRVNPVQEIETPTPMRLDGFWSVDYTNDGFRSISVDYLAQKPIYYDQELGLYASEFRAFKAIKEYAINPLYISNVMKWGYDPTGLTPYIGIEAIRPGHTYIPRLKGQKRYTNKGAAERKFNGHDMLLMSINKAVYNRMTADVPVAVLCSGGLDSTIVAMLVDKYATGPVHIFHVENDESQYLDLIPWSNKVNLHSVSLDDVSMEDGVHIFQQPVDLGSVRPQIALARALKKEGFHACLTGDGADELFGGYGRNNHYDSQQSDIWCELVNYHLPRLDTIMAYHQIELRTPFLAPSVLAIAQGLPWGYRTDKNILKCIYKDFIPRPILDRDKKALRIREIFDAQEKGSYAYRQQLVDIFYSQHMRSNADHE